MSREKVIKVLKERPIPSLPKKYREMPISQHVGEIVSAIRDNPIVAVSAATGSGKTRLIPYVLALYGLNVRVSIPTIVAVTSSYDFTSTHSTMNVGYAAGRSVNYKPDTSLVYATTGHYTKKLLTHYTQRLPIKEILGDILVIDEVHIGSSQTTLLFGLIKYLFTKEDRPSIVLSSATLDGGEMENFFGDEYKLYRLNLDLQSPFIVDFYFQVDSRDIMKSPANPLIADLIRDRLRMGKKGNGIVFRPGYLEVESTVSYLSKEIPSVTFLPAYSSLSEEELSRIFNPPYGMLVVVGTNIIESSITLKDISFVIDDMLEKLIETTLSGGSRLSTKLISKAASTQRAGRTGRTMNGDYYPLITTEEYKQLPDFRVREVERVPIYDILIQLLDAKLDPIKILDITRDKYELGFLKLKKYGMIKENSEVTEAGRFVSRLSLTIEPAYMIFLGYEKYITMIKTGDARRARLFFRTVIAVATMISVHSPPFFYIPSTERPETYKDAHYARFKGRDDIHTFANIYWSLLDDLDNDLRRANTVKEWCLKNSMNYKKISELITTLNSVYDTIENELFGDPDLIMDPYYALVQPEILIGDRSFISAQVSEIFRKAYYFNSMEKAKGKGGFKDKSTRLIYDVNKRGSSYCDINLNEVDRIIVAETFEIMGVNGRKLLADIITTA